MVTNFSESFPDTVVKPHFDRNTITEWLPMLSEHDNLQGVVYLLLLTKDATPYVERMIDWYLSEREYVNESILIQALATAAQTHHAPALWALCQHRPPQDHVWFMVQLTRFRNVADAVTQTLVELLYSGDALRIGIALKSLE